MNTFQMMAIAKTVAGVLTPEIGDLIQRFFKSAVASKNPNEFVRDALERALGETKGDVKVTATVRHEKLKG